AGATDEQLLKAFLNQREEGSLDMLVRRHARMVWGVCCRMLGDRPDAEDAFQATFLVFLRKIASISSPAKIGNWLYGVARQTSLRVRETRAKRKAHEMNVEDVLEPAEREREPESVLDQELSLLPEKYRTVIVLCDLEGMTRREVACRLRLPEG